MPNNLTYAKSGVNIRSADKFVKFISKITSKQNKNKEQNNIGSFGSISKIPSHLKNVYIVDASIDSDLFEDDGSKVEILPGMVASVDVLAGKRTILDYIWNPMIKVKERAFTD